VLFNSHVFLFAFLPAVLVGAFALRRFGRPEAVPFWLLAASLFFYAHWDPRLLLLLLGSIGFNWALARAVASPEAPLRQRRLLLGLGVGANLLLLAQCKYARFFTGVLNDSTGSDLPLPAVILPLAISFYTFQQIAFLVDSFRGETGRPRLRDYALFVSFFPQLIAGPIVTHRELLSQLTRRDLGPTAARLAPGLTLFLAGLVKKVLIADTLAPLADPIFDAAAGEAVAVADAWGAALAYTFQLYFDFSGYSDMAIGLGLMFGISLPLNFDSPYKAESVIDFWRRWHMTLSRFLRNYLYFPLGGSRRGASRRRVNLLATMLLGGLWHGAGWNFVLWGGLHGLYLILNHGWRSLRGARENPTPLGRAAARGGTFLAVLVAWVLFRAETPEAAFGMLAGMAGLAGATAPATLGADTWAGLLALLAAVWLLPNSQQWLALEGGAAPGRLAWRPSPGWAVVLGTGALLAVLGLVESAEFIYFRF
jgi:D-alanyl-lipoteichoic acid acyltransferase DltB (MBOAT superfamily)